LVIFTLLDLTFQGEVRVGDEMIDEWRVPEGNDPNMFGIVGITQSSCVPLSYAMFNGTSEMTEESLWNFVADVPPNLFDLPAQCQKSLNVIFIDIELTMKVRSMKAVPYVHVPLKFW
jgi:hypothetical protein